MRFRNFLFDIGLRSSKHYSFPVICVGNLRVGGTGKTPHIEYLVAKLKDDFHLATLSRGYGRKTKGFKIADSSDTAETIGDEPYQIFNKFPEIVVSVDEKRRNGIDNLRKLPSPPQIVLLDDAFQHRQVKAGFNILLTDYSNLYINDFVLPSGRLREPKSGARRADIIVITKSPPVISPLELRRITATLKPIEYQKVFFSFIKYGRLKPLNNRAREIEKKKNIVENNAVLLVSAIDNPKPLLLHLKRYSKEIDSIQFRDHYFFKEKDYKKIDKQLEKLLSQKRMIVITEKDEMKFDSQRFENIPVFSIPIEVDFHSVQEENFEKEIRDYVRSH